MSRRPLGMSNAMAFALEDAEHARQNKLAREPQAMTLYFVAYRKYSYPPQYLVGGPFIAQEDAKALAATRDDWVVMSGEMLLAMV